MTSFEHIQDSIREFIWVHFPVAKRRLIGDGDSLLASGIVDSLGVLEVVQFIEEEFRITLSDDAMLSENFETITAIADFVARRLQPDCMVNRQA